MRVLIACEFSGTVRDAFAARGYSTDDIVADTLAQLADQLVARAGGV